MQANPPAARSDPSTLRRVTSTPKAFVALALAALLGLVLSGCSSPATTSTNSPPADHGSKAKTLEFSLDKAASGAEVRVDLAVFAYSADRSESYAWNGNLTLKFTVTHDTVHYPDCGTSGKDLTVTRAVRTTGFTNPIGAGEHWNLPLSVSDANLGTGQYKVHATANLDSGATLEADGSFNHCG